MATRSKGALFRNRIDAGQALASRLACYAGRPDVLVLGLPRGGLPVAYKVALALKAPLDVFVVRKLGVPGHEELAMGAIATGGTRVLNAEVVEGLGISSKAIDEVTAREQRELERREAAYRGLRPAPSVAGRTVVLVDDGVATGSTMRAAVASVRQQSPARIVVAVPVASSIAYDELRREADELVCIATPEPFYAVGLWYQDFSQTTDDEIRDLLKRAHARHLRDVA